MRMCYYRANFNIWVVQSARRFFFSVSKRRLGRSANHFKMGKEKRRKRTGGSRRLTLVSLYIWESKCSLEYTGAPGNGLLSYLGVEVTKAVIDIHVLSNRSLTQSSPAPQIKRSQIRKGMVMVDKRLEPQACWEFEAEVLVLHHPTTISPKYQAMGKVAFLVTGRRGHFWT